MRNLREIPEVSLLGSRKGLRKKLGREDKWKTTNTPILFDTEMITNPKLY
jgi:hypothetical protein